MGHNQRDGTFLPANQDKRVKKKRMVSLMRNTDEEIETNCKLVRDVIESQRKQKRETVLKFEELFEKENDPKEQI